MHIKGLASLYASRSREGQGPHGKGRRERAVSNQCTCWEERTEEEAVAEIEEAVESDAT
jgi:hypothetical protein